MKAALADLANRRNELKVTIEFTRDKPPHPRNTKYEKTFLGGQRWRDVVVYIKGQGFKDVKDELDDAFEPFVYIGKYEPQMDEYLADIYQLKTWGRTAIPARFGLSAISSYTG